MLFCFFYFFKKSGKLLLIKDYRRGTEYLLGMIACNVEKEVTYYKLLWTNLTYSADKIEGNTHRPAFSMHLVMCFIKKLSLDGFSR